MPAAGRWVNSVTAAYSTTSH
uniref:Uncharacterized protein n=1 Tax=Arundo donax TaxID=35708 RepID=A0A0A9GY61_ARUDO